MSKKIVNNDIQNNVDWSGVISRIKYLRSSKGLSQLSLASKIGMSRSAYGQFETGTIKLSVDSLVNISRVFNVSLEQLVFGCKEQIHIDNSEKSEVNYKVEILVVKNMFKSLNQDLLSLKSRIEKIENK